MRVALISLIWNIQNPGVRYLSSTLRRSGHKTLLIFHPRMFRDHETDAELGQLTALLHDWGADLVGINLFSHGVRRCRRMVARIRRDTDLPVILGGPHPSLSPEESLRFADAVCLGEGEEPMRRLCNAMERGEDSPAIEGIWFRRNGRIVRNPRQRLSADLDNTPFPDLGLSNNYVLHEGRLRPLSEEILLQYRPHLSGHYLVLTSRGCPFSCTYCCNHALRKVYAPGVKWPRRRSPGNVIDELKFARTMRPNTEKVLVVDECFSAAPVDWLREWANAYRREIALPFICSAAPNTITDEKVRLLTDAGLYRVHIGIQTGSERINRDIYRRPIPRKAILHTDKVLSQYPVQRFYDVITDSPYGSEKDRLQTVDLLSRLKKPFALYMYHLTFYPGAALTERAKADGVPRSRLREFETRNYLRCERDTLNSLIYLARILPGRLMRQITRSRALRQAYSLGYDVYHLVRYELLTLFPVGVKSRVRWLLHRSLAVLFGLSLAPQPKKRPPPEDCLGGDSPRYADGGRTR